MISLPSRPILYSVMVFPSKSSNFVDRLAQDAAHRWLFCLYITLLQSLMSNQQPDYNYDDFTAQAR